MSKTTRYVLAIGLIGQLLHPIRAHADDSGLSTSEVPNRVSPHYQSSMALAWQAYLAKQHEQAVSLYQQALEFSPDSIDAKLWILLQRISHKDWAGARQEGKEILLSNPDNHWANRYMALVDYMQGRHRDAERRYWEALAQSPKDPLMELGLGLSLVMQNRIREGRIHCGRARATLRRDPRVDDCLRIAPKKWTTISQFYVQSGGYTAPLDRDIFASGLVIVEAIAPSGFGFEVDLSGAWSSLPFAEDNSQQYGMGAALFYTGKHLSGWIHYAALSSPNAFGQVVSAYGEYGKLEDFKLGAELAVGLYDGFQTVQFSPEFSYKPTRWLTGTLRPMLQLRFGELQRAEGARDTTLRMSTDISLSASERRGSLSVSAFIGERWFTVENRGLLIWNVDEDIRAGLRAALLLWPKARVSPSLRVRIDFVDHQFGIAHETYVLALAAGVSTTF